MNQDPKCPFCKHQHPVGRSCPKGAGRGIHSLADEAAKGGKRRLEKEPRGVDAVAVGKHEEPRRFGGAAAGGRGQDLREKEPHGGQQDSASGLTSRHGLNQSLEAFLGDVLALQKKLNEERRSLSQPAVEVLMRQDEPWARPERGFDQADYVARLREFSIPDEGDGFHEEQIKVDRIPVITYRLYINALPSQAVEIFRSLMLTWDDESKGLVETKIAGSGSWKGRRDLVVAYFVNAKSACLAARRLSIRLALKAKWPESWVRRDILPGTFRVAPGMGVAWDPLHVYLSGNVLPEVFGKTHTLRYSAMILKFLEQRAFGQTLEQTAPVFARWMQQYGDPAKPYNPPKVYLSEGYDEEVLD
jgi:hypothetical protein